MVFVNNLNLTQLKLVYRFYDEIYANNFSVIFKSYSYFWAESFDRDLSVKLI